MYHLLQQNKPIRTSLIEKFEARLEARNFKDSNEPYYLLHLPLVHTRLNINGKEMRIVNQHFTMPQKEDEKTKSCYHYTLVLADTQTGEEYVTHLYCDALDRITMDPMLVSGERDFTSLDIASLEAIRAYSINAFSVILFIREMQNNQIQSILEQVNITELKLKELSPYLDDINTRSTYIELLKAQIQALKLLQILGYSLRNSEMRFYSRMLKTLQDWNRDELAATAVVQQSTNVSSQEENSSESVEEQPTPKKVTRQKRKESALEQLQKSCLRCMTHFDTAKTIDAKAKIIETMVNKVFECHNSTFMSQKDCFTLLNIKQRLVEIIIDFITATGPSSCPREYILAVKAGILPLQDDFLAEVLQRDSVDTLKLLMTFNLISDTTLLKLSNEPKSLTFPQWCFHFGAVKCLNELSNNNFAIDHRNSDANELFTELALDPLKSHDNLSHELNLNTRIRLARKFEEVLNIKTQSATGMELELLRARIEFLYEAQQYYAFALGNRLLKTKEDDTQVNVPYPRELLKEMNTNIRFIRISTQHLKLQAELHMRTSKSMMLGVLRNQSRDDAKQGTLEFLASGLSTKQMVQAIIEDLENQVQGLFLVVLKLRLADENSSQRHISKMNAKSRQNKTLVTAFNQLKLDDKKSISSVATSTTRSTSTNTSEKKTDDKKPRKRKHRAKKTG
ncbi:hypothetical protein [Candidatus Berkiella aquae]|uniref:Uncharacterized protein n=1 Tax=Candidatus Berkiella aquae TaxID=295108 RepID=A0A0Q9YCZ0_9GAMM|nr:hypothetical protein [Candidatus Berkiella aquae]MCS5709889.1 hypothetical protein [Candidatus Berkiella aquae]